MLQESQPKKCLLTTIVRVNSKHYISINVTLNITLLFLLQVHMMLPLPPSPFPDPYRHAVLLVSLVFLW